MPFNDLKDHLVNPLHIIIFNKSVDGGLLRPQCVIRSNCHLTEGHVR